MQYFGTIGDIKERAGALNLSLTRLCEKSGVAASTGLRAGSDPRVSTLRKLSDGLLGHEREQLLRLARLHPDLVTINQQQSEAAE